MTRGRETGFIVFDTVNLSIEIQPFRLVSSSVAHLQL